MVSKLCVGYPSVHTFGHMRSKKEPDLANQPHALRRYWSCTWTLGEMRWMLMQNVMCQPGCTLGATAFMLCYGLAWVVAADAVQFLRFNFISNWHTCTHPHSASPHKHLLIMPTVILRVYRFKLLMPSIHLNILFTVLSWNYNESH